MDFGIFDHLDRGEAALPDFYEGRLALAEAYDKAGFRSYHLAEHHSTPLGMAPSPSLFLAALAQRTKRLRFGPLVYCLPLHQPLRLIEEICMLDQMSRGRLELGVGRGISPIEASYYGQDPKTSTEIYTEALELVLKGLTSKTLDFAGKFYRFANVPMELEPAQKPHPPVWLGMHSPATAEWAGRQGYNGVSLDTAADARVLAERHRAGRREAGIRGAAPRFGISRFIVVAESDAEAAAIARRAYPKWFKSFNHLYRLHGRGPVLGERPADFDALNRQGAGIAGTTRTVTEFVRAQIAESGVNYFVGQFAFGDVTTAEALRSVKLFARDVMPAVRV